MILAHIVYKCVTQGFRFLYVNSPEFINSDIGKLVRVCKKSPMYLERHVLFQEEDMVLIHMFETVRLEINVVNNVNVRH